MKIRNAVVKKIAITIIDIFLCFQVRICFFNVLVFNSILLIIIKNSLVFDN